MATLAILRPPPSLRSGDDVLSEMTVAGLTAAGLSAELHELWPEWWANNLWNSTLPGHRRLFELIPARLSLRSLENKIRNCRAVWICGSSLPIDPKGSFEKARLDEGQDYIFHLQDDWFSIDGARERASRCMHLATLVVVPTRALKERVLALFPSAKVLVLEEPIDTNRFVEAPKPIRTNPFLVWTGNPNNLKEIPGFAETLRKIYSKEAFTLRIICGKVRPKFEIGIPTEWYPFCHFSEGRLLAGATAGLAPMGDTAYARCKGSYKVKTYLAAGIAVVASPVGHQADLIADGYTGFLPNCEEEWIERITILLHDDRLAAELGAIGQKYAKENFSHAVLMPKWASEIKGNLSYK